MNKYKTIDIIAAVIACIGLIIQVKYDDRGLYIVLFALVISIISHIIKGRKEKEITPK